MRFRVPKHMRDTGTISVQGQSFDVDGEGYFEAPDHFAEHVSHLGVVGAPVEAAKPEEKAPAKGEAKK